MTMISYIVQTVDLLALIFIKFIGISAFVGGLIVNFISSVITLVVNIISNVLLFFQIVYEDNLYIFTEDIPCFINHLNNMCNSVLESVIVLCNGISYMCLVSISALEWFIELIIIVCGDVLRLLKETLIIFGGALWLLLTFVPVHLPYLLKALLDVIIDAYDAYGLKILLSYVMISYVMVCVCDLFFCVLYNAPTTQGILGWGCKCVALFINIYYLYNFTDFLSDVSLESCIGILSAMLIAWLCIHHRETVQFQVKNIYWKIKRKVLYLYYTLYNYFIDSEVSIRDVDLSNAEVDDAVNAVNSLCVICQERQKCILTLPCLHICLCTECYNRLYDYQPTCPMCRTFVYHSVTVYL